MKGKAKSKSGTAEAKKAPAKKNIAASYNHYKMFGGQQYTGMKIGAGHKWYYDKGEWHDKKITPDLWTISYAVTKRRAGKAPEGSGAPVGTEYHWYILAHQMVKKLDANSYTTEMTGLKYKVAHKRAATGKWNITERGQKKRLIRFLKEMITRLETEDDVQPVAETKVAVKAATSKKTGTKAGTAAPKKTRPKKPVARQKRKTTVPSAAARVREIA